MTKPPSSTTEQLRALMQSHVTMTSAKPESPRLEPPAAVSPAPPSARAPKSKPKPETSAGPELTMPARFSLRLRPSELAKINAILNKTLAQTGQRLTLTDVLRVGLGRLGESLPLSEAEIATLRATDSRRAKAIIQA